MPGKVADASVLGALVFGESRAEEAAALLAEGPLYEPTLLAYELASIARKKIFQDPDLHSSITQTLGRALAAEMNWVDVDYLETLRLAVESGLTTYDASYLYVAQSLDVGLVTFDDQLRSAWQSYAR